mmetsp:Transcript_11582/g.17548  ORF Transcript_11582/g.17548 Transcript_11582/m.17548 type:complete len:267 (-) Transcript_11582:44-844(-)
MIFHIISSIDTSIRRIDKHALPQETLMELLTEGITTAGGVTRPIESAINPLDRCKGLTLNTDGDVIEIDWAGTYRTQGTLNLRWLPLKLKKFDVKSNKFHGTLYLRDLPSELVGLFLDNNQFEGSIDLSQLPDTLEELNVGHNNLSGSLDLTSLPRSLRVLDLNTNSFSGSVDLTRLPGRIHLLSLAANELSGPVRLTNLPDSMKRFYLNRNGFEGETDFRRLPDLEYFNVSDTNLSGVIPSFGGRYLGRCRSKVKCVQENAHEFK